MSRQFITGICQLLTAVSALVFISCTPGISDGGLETTNGYISVITSDSTLTGTTTPAATIILCDRNYTPDDTTSPFIDSTTSDADGTYGFDDLSPGTYNLLAWNSSGDSSALCASISLPDHSGPDTIRFEPNSAISGVVLLNSIPRDSTVVSIIGTPFTTVTDPEGSYVLNAIPQGSYRITATRLFYTRDLPVEFHAENIIDITGQQMFSDTLRLSLQ